VRNLRLLPEQFADGATNMATDEALLEAAERPTLRLYGWTRATISLGYFQEHDAVLASLPRADPGPDLVRRITGGGAIWHEHEVTYCLVGVLGADGFPGSARELYPLLHRAVRAELIRRGAALGLQADAVGDRRYRDEPRCFASPAADDLTAPGGGKALGSAARTRARRILVHGSLKLASNPWDGAVTAPCGVDREGAAAALRDGISRALGLALTSGEETAAEAEARARIRAARYGDARWVRERVGPKA
jgi:lipoate-protein ligase A